MFSMPWQPMEAFTLRKPVQLPFSADQVHKFFPTNSYGCFSRETNGHCHHSIGRSYKRKVCVTVKGLDTTPCPSPGNQRGRKFCQLLTHFQRNGGLLHDESRDRDAQHSDGVAMSRESICYLLISRLPTTSWPLLREDRTLT